MKHGQIPVLGTDARDANCKGLTGSAREECQKNNKFAKYDKSSLTVFGSDGAVIPPDDLATGAGIKKIVVGASRTIKIYTVKDDRDPPVERVVIRVKGTVTSNGKTFWDYYRVVIVHERGPKATQLESAYMESGVAFIFEENEATTIAYVGDGGALVLQEAPLGDAIFDDTEVICVAGVGQAVRHPFHSAFGVSSYGFILDYAGGPGSDVFYIPSSNQVSRN
ncbi:MAG: hypothetical protein IIA90_03045, partial [Chloroflexi bacterium]|nr:hypothetical protein [Chloroflexota bacterium]